ncbi:MAG: CBS domain-containing protein [Anaerolineae bacterium]|nr:CBS domain-containing protein [Anaerolineae bacterium]
MLVRDAMTSRPITVHPESDCLAAIALMRAGRFSRIPVVDETNRLVGVVSDDDVASLEVTRTTKSDAFRSDGVLVRVEEVMSAEVFTITPDYPLEEAASLMVRHRVGCLPVVDDSLHVVGIITETDVFQTFVQVLGGGSHSHRVTVALPNTPGELAALTAQIAQAGGNIDSIAALPTPDGHALAFTLRVESIPLAALLEAIGRCPGAALIGAWEGSA